ncbi:hypothetical protein [Synechococcus sp. CC9605]|nr:hypothetical protein [Synechococcus sp. CC9605]
MLIPPRPLFLEPGDIPKWVIFATAYIPQLRDAVEQLQQGAPPRDERGH